MQRLLFGKRKHKVSSGDDFVDQYVEAVVSPREVLSCLRDVLLKRQDWLRQQGKPINYQMRDGKNKERELFVKHCKDEYHSTPEQQRLQERDRRQHKKKVLQRKHSRWSIEMQRRLGSKKMWEIVSFTGNYSVDFLKEVQYRSMRNISAIQRDDDERNKQRMLTAKAVKCRHALRWAQNWAAHLRRKRQHSQISKLSNQEKKLLEELNSGELEKRANDATEASGHGRIRNSDGTYTCLLYTSPSPRDRG